VSDLFALLNRATRALDAQRFGLDVAGQNVANVNTPGYVRRALILADVPPPDLQSSGGGVDAVAVVASRAPLVEARLRFEQPAASREQAKAESLAVVEAGLGQPGESIDAELAKFYNTYGALAQNPTSSPSRQQVILAGQSLARAFSDMSARFDEAQRTADADVRATVTQINTLAAQLADINRQISETESANTQGLVDQQTAVVQEIGKLVDVGYIAHADGTVDLSVGNGRALVIGQYGYPLQLAASPFTGFATITATGGSPTDVTDEISGGRVGGLIQVRDTLLPSYRSQLDQLAYSMANDVNALTTTGYDLNGNAGLAFFTPPAAVSGAARLLIVNPAVAANNALIVASATTTSGNNDIARAVQALQDNPMTGSTARPVDGWGSLVYSVATDAAGAQQSQKAHEQVTVQLQNLRDQISGVSLDEEAAMLMKFQRAYEANARFFQIASATLDTLLSLAGR
jgi:flagellar hook-associated protein 1 FlgK